MSYILGPWEYKHGSVSPQYDEDTRPVAYIPLWEDNHQLREARGHLIAAAPNLYDVCDTVSSRTVEVQEMMRREGIVIDDLEDFWQKFAFTLYTIIATDAVRAEKAIAKAKGESDD